MEIRRRKRFCIICTHSKYCIDKQCFLKCNVSFHIIPQQILPYILWDVWRSFIGVRGRYSYICAQRLCKQSILVRVNAFERGPNNWYIAPRTRRVRGQLYQLLSKFEGINLFILFLRRFSNTNPSTLNTLSQDFSTFLHKFYLIIYLRAITDILITVHQRKPTQKQNKDN